MAQQGVAEMVTIRKGTGLGLALALLVAAGVWSWSARTGEPVDEQEYRATTAAAATGGPLRPIYSAKTKEKQVALTFDISWGEKMAPKVLDVLKHKNLKATFFLSGPWAKRHSEVVARIVADGHEVQSHGQEHDNFSGLGREGVARNIQAAHAILHELTGRTASFIRPPNGDFNQTSLQSTRDVGYQTVIWSVDSIDWMNPGVEAIISRVTKKIHPGAIILMHASDSCKQTDQALPVVIDNLQHQGYQFLLLSDLMRNGPDPNGRIW